MTRTCTIRAGRYDDMFAVEKLLLASMRESAIPLPPMEVPHCYHWYISMVADEMVYVADIDGKLVGAIALGIDRWPWTTAHSGPEGAMVSMPGFYVVPAFRKYGTAMKLLRRAEERASALGLPFMVNTTTGVDPDIKDRFVRMMGYTQAGGAFWKVPAR